MKTTHFLMTAILAVSMAMTCAMMTSCAKEDNPVDSVEFIENGNGKEELDFGGGDVPMVGAMTGYIYDAKVLGCKNKKDIVALINKYKSEGWTVIDQELNAEAGGKYIYLAVKTCNLNSPHQGTAISDFYLSDSKNEKINGGYHTYFRVGHDGDGNFDGNLNSGAGGTTFYLYYTKEARTDNCAVTRVYFNDNSGSEGGNPVVGLNGITAGDPQNVAFKGFDLNTKTKKKGQEIYMHMENSATVPRWRSDVFERDYQGYILGDLQSVKVAAIPLTFDGQEVMKYYVIVDYYLPNLEVLNFYSSSAVSEVNCLTQSDRFKHVNVLDEGGNIVKEDGLPNSIRSIGYYAFRRTGLEKIYLHQGLKAINPCAFQFCSQLKAIYFEGTKSQWGTVNKRDNWNDGVSPDCKIYYNSNGEWGEI